MSTVTAQVYKNDPDFLAIKPHDCGRYLVISLGAGAAKLEQKHDAHKASKWGLLGWLYTDNTNPIIDCFSHASSDMVDFHNSILFQTLNSADNYLRIQVTSYFPGYHNFYF